MKLKNKSKRLITVNIENKKVKVLPGNNPSVEFSQAEIKKSKFLKALIDNGDLVQDGAKAIYEDDSDELVMLQADCISKKIKFNAKDSVEQLKEKLKNANS